MLFCCIFKADRWLLRDIGIAEQQRFEKEWEQDILITKLKQEVEDQKEEIQALLKNAKNMVKTLDLLESENDGLRFANEKLNVCHSKLYACKTIDELGAWEFI